MGNSFADQLLKAGIANKKQAQKAKQEKRQKELQQRNQKKSAAKVVDEQTLAQQKIAAEKAERDRELNRQIKAEADRKAIQAQIRQLIELNNVSLKGAEEAYNFTDDKVVQRVLVTGELLKQISKGRMAIAKFDGSYAVIPIAAAEKIQQRDADCIVVLNSQDNSQPDEDDPYADFQVPDDLMW